MEIIARILHAIIAVLNLWMAALLLFQLVISFFGYRKNTKNYKDHDPKLRFLILVPAHNEETVIGEMVENLQHMEYPRELYDFYILADNCTDHTADVVRSRGGNVLEFSKSSPDEATGKPIVLSKALNALAGYGDKYDLVMFFDADNLIDPNMLLEVNSQFLDADGKADVVQCYLGCKNRKGPVALFYYMSYTITNRFFQYAKSRLGLNCVIGGTGFAVSAPYLQERGGWTAMSLTEDFELQIASTIEGKRILWNNNVRVYDEKPTSLHASFRQRTRWAQGHWFVAFRNTVPLFKAVLTKKIRFWEFVSTLLYMYSLTPNVIIIGELFLLLLEGLSHLTGIGTGFMDILGVSGMFSINVFGLLVFFYSFVFLFYAGEVMDNHLPADIKALPAMLVSMLVNTLAAGWAQVVGLFKHRQQHTWVKTEHKIHKLEDMTVKHLPSSRK